MKFLSHLIGAFDGVMLVVTTLAMAAPFFLALMHPGASIGHVG